jgi:hypothetical protein
VRTDWQVYPLTAELQLPRSASLGGTVRADLTLTNIIKSEVKRVKIELVKTAGIEQVGAIPAIPTLSANDNLTKHITVRLTGPNAARANRFMVCVRVTWPEGDYGKQVRADLPRMLLVMKYVQGK